jgi:glutathione S-transferase
MLKLLGRPSSINVRKVLWTCAELGLDIELEAWGSGFRSTQTPEFLALNPNGLIPVLVDNGRALWESNTICRYLAARQGRVDLLPAVPLARAEVEQWMDWQAAELNPAWRYAFMALVRVSLQHTDPQATAASVTAWNRLMVLLDRQLETTSAYVTGPSFTLADVVLGLSCHRWYMTPMERPPLPSVQRWFDGLKPRAGFREHADNGVP